MFTDILTKTLEWFQRAVPNPTSKNIHTQLGCHFEEVNELLMLLNSDDFQTQIKIDNAKMTLNELASHLKASDNVLKIDPKDREEILDAFCDQIVTGVGSAYMLDMDVLNGMVEVNRSNFSKFDDFGHPIYDTNLKVKKGPNYTRACHQPFV